MKERFKCILIAIIIDVMLLNCSLMLYLISVKCKTAFLVILLLGMVFCTYKAVKGYRGKLNDKNRMVR